MNHSQNKTIPIMFITQHKCKNFCAKECCICFCNLVCVAWDGLKADILNDDRVESYAEYFDETWING